VSAFTLPRSTRPIAVGALFAALTMSAPAFADVVIYNSIPSPLPTNVTSLGYECCEVNEFGNEVGFSGTARQLTDVTVTMSNWAYQSVYPGFGTATGFTVPLTLNLYNAGAGGAVGSLIATDTINAFIQWRPEPDGCSGVGSTTFTGSGGCFNGLAENVTFDFTGVTVPDQVIYGLAFNTYSYGAAPTGVQGPYDSLNFGLTTTSPSVGTNVVPGTLDINAAGPYPVTSATPGTFGPDTNWAPYSPAIEFDATVPEPATFSVLAIGLAGLAAARRRRRS